MWLSVRGPANRDYPGPMDATRRGTEDGPENRGIGFDLMRTGEPGNVPATVAHLGLPGRAVTALARAGITRVDDLAVLTRRDLAAITGLGPGMIAAIRLVVPEPPTGLARGAAPDADREEAGAAVVEPEPDQADEETPDAPAIPSFASLRSTRRGTALDVLVPGPLLRSSPPLAPALPPVPAATGRAPAGAPRAAEYADLLRLAGRVIRALDGVPARMALWSIREPVRSLGRLLTG
jgi:hypothetical protein